MVKGMGAYIAMLAGLAACGSQAVPTSPESPFPDMATRALGFMTDVGCKAYDGESQTGVVTLPLRDGTFVKIDCRGVSPQKVHAGVQAFNRSEMPSDEPGRHLPAAQANGSSKTYYTCEVEFTYTYFPAVGEYLLTDVDVNWCTTYTIYTPSGELSGEWGDPGGTGEYGPVEGTINAVPLSVSEVLDQFDSLPFPPSCDAASKAMSKKIKAWCEGQTLNARRRAAYDTAVTRIRSRGGPCGRIADVLEALVTREPSEVRVHTWDGNRNSEYLFAGGAPVNPDSGYGHVEGWVTLGSSMLDTYNQPNRRFQAKKADGGTFYVGLDDVLVHEAMHLDGVSHAENVVGNQTVAACGFGGVPY